MVGFTFFLFPTGQKYNQRPLPERTQHQNQLPVLGEIDNLRVFPVSRMEFLSFGAFLLVINFSVIVNNPVKVDEYLRAFGLNYPFISAFCAQDGTEWPFLDFKFISPWRI